MEMESPEEKREYFYDRAGRLVSENGEACFREAQRGNRRRIQIRILGQGNRGKPQGEDNKICVRRLWDAGAKDFSRR